MSYFHILHFHFTQFFDTPFQIDEVDEALERIEAVDSATSVPLKRPVQEKFEEPPNTNLHRELWWSRPKRDVFQMIKDKARAAERRMAARTAP